MHGGHESGGEDGEGGEGDEQRAPNARAIGEPAQEGRRDGDHAHGDRDHATPPEVPRSALVAHHGHRVVRGVDGGEDDGGEGGVGEVVERPGDDAPGPHEALPSSTGSGTWRRRSWNSSMIARRRASRWRRRSRSRSTARSPRVSRRNRSRRSVHESAKNAVGSSETRKSTRRGPPPNRQAVQPSSAQQTGKTRMPTRTLYVASTSGSGLSARTTSAVAW